MSIFIEIAIWAMNVFYFFVKLFPTKNKVVLISREKSTPSLDFLLLERKIKNIDDSIEVVMLCRRLEKDWLSRIKYIFHMIRQMYHIATSKVVVLDTYCITVSCLKHKKSLTVIQMWHAMGSFKKFGYSILDKKEGSSSKIAKAMRMHKNYDYIFSSSENDKKNFAEAFGYSDQLDKLVVMPLPRVDLLKDKDNIMRTKEEVLKKYPALKKKKTILYAPTFRKDKSMVKDITKLIDAVDYSKYNLVIKLHPLSKTVIDDKRVIFDNSFSTFEIGCASHYMITDYSAVVFELSLLSKPIFFYAYDKESYIGSRDFYMNYDRDMPGVISKTADEVMANIEAGNYDIKKVKKFADYHIATVKGGYTRKVAKFIIKHMKKS